MSAKAVAREIAERHLPLGCSADDAADLALDIERAILAAVEAEREFWQPLVHHMTMMLDDFGQHEPECCCSGDHVKHASDCLDCECGLADAINFGVKHGGPLEPEPMTEEEEQRFHEICKLAVDQALAGAKARARGGRD